MIKIIKTFSSIIVRVHSSRLFFFSCIAVCLFIARVIVSIFLFVLLLRVCVIRLGLSRFVRFCGGGRSRLSLLFF